MARREKRQFTGPMGGVVTSWRLEWRAAVWLLLPRCCRAAVGEFCQRTVEKGHDTAPAGTRVTENVSCVPSFKQLFQMLTRSIFIILTQHFHHFPRGGKVLAACLASLSPGPGWLFPALPSPSCFILVVRRHQSSKKNTRTAQNCPK